MECSTELSLSLEGVSWVGAREVGLLSKERCEPKDSEINTNVDFKDNVKDERQTAMKK